MKLKGSRVEVLRGNGLFFTAEGRPAVEKVQKDDVRPHPPIDQRKSKWILGDVTEVLDHNSWKLGKIAKVLKNNYFVIRLTGCIQLREFHISRLRVPHACHRKQSLAIEKVTGRGKQNQLANHTFPCSKVVMELGHQAHEEEGHTAKRSEAINLGLSTSARNLKNNPGSSRRMPPDDFVRETGKKRKATAYKFHQPNKRPLPEKGDTASFVADNCFYRPFSDRYSELAEINVDKRNPDSQVLCSSLVPLQVRRENECSVASCSINDLEYSTSDNRRSIRFTSCFPDDAMSACPSTTGREKADPLGNELATNIHELELQAYQSTVQAFYASGPLTWEQESLLTNLRLSLNISNEEHLLQLRHLLST